VQAQHKNILGILQPSLLHKHLIKNRLLCKVKASFSNAIWEKNWCSKSGAHTHLYQLFPVKFLCFVMLSSHLLTLSSRRWFNSSGSSSSWSFFFLFIFVRIYCCNILVACKMSRYYLLRSHILTFFWIILICDWWSANISFIFFSWS